MKLFNLIKDYVTDNQTLLFSMWRCVWCTYITIIACLNIVRMDKLLGTLSDMERHRIYDGPTVGCVWVVIGCIIIDMVIFSIYRKFYRFHLVVHHVIAIVLGSIALYVSHFTTMPHHYTVNMFMSTEVVTTIILFAFFGKRKKKRVYYKMYLVMYILLTIFWRGYVWIILLNDAILAESKHWACIIGTVPLIVLDIIWVKQCIDGLYYTEYNKSLNDCDNGSDDISVSRHDSLSDGSENDTDSSGSDIVTMDSEIDLTVDITRYNDMYNNIHEHKD